MIDNSILFSEFMKIWLKNVEPFIDNITYQGYCQVAQRHIIPYFEVKKISLKDITINDLQTYFDDKYRFGRLDNKGGLSSKSLKLHRNVINQTLNEALKYSLIPVNLCRLVRLPKVERRIPSFYTSEQINKLLSCIKFDYTFYLLVKLTATYGLRRSEVLGLEWSNISFNNNSFVIAHTVVKLNSTVKKDKTKNSSSFRSFPLIPDIKELLIKQRNRQLYFKDYYGFSYIKSDYVFTWEDGKPYSTEYVSQHFHRLIVWNDLPPIRFHDLRHSCASILLSKGFTLKDVQEWLGHSNISLTADLYGHLDFERKKAIADSFL